MPLFPIMWTNPLSRFSVGSRKLIDKAVVGDAVLTTDRHPFWDASAGAFVYAVDLQPGELVLTLDGQPIEVSTVEVHEEDLTAYNLEIGGIHTYYAGETPVLVHNTCPPAEGTPRTNTAQNKQFSDAIKDAEDTLQRRLSKDERNQVHREISGQNYGYHDIVDEVLNMFGVEK